MGIIASRVEEKDTTNVVITGDFNAAVDNSFEAKLIATCTCDPILVWISQIMRVVVELAIRIRM